MRSGWKCFNLQSISRHLDVFIIILSIWYLKFNVWLIEMSNKSKCDTHLINILLMEIL